MLLNELLAPIGVEKFKQEFFGQRCLLLKRKKNNPLSGLLSVDQLDARLNDGVATLAGVNVIQPNGNKLPPGELIEQRAARATGWTPRFLKKGRVRELMEQGCSIVVHNMSAITPQVEALVSDIEGQIQDAQADVHIYISPRAGATGYNAHKDVPQHKIYLQLIGETDWTVFQGEDPRTAMPKDEAVAKLGIDFEATLTPGSVLYMPPGVFHHACSPRGPRVSLSIPFYAMPGLSAPDRTRIPLSDWFS